MAWCSVLSYWNYAVDKARPLRQDSAHESIGTRGTAHWSGDLGPNILFAWSMKPIPDDSTQVVRQGVENAVKDFSKRVEPLGFKGSKKMLWVRRHQHTVDFITLFRRGSSYGRPINYSVSLDVEFGIRVLNDTFEGLSPNGPRYDFSERLRAAHYHFRFNAQTGSTYARCVDDLARYVVHEGEPWFLRFRDPHALLASADSPLRQPEKERLRAAVDGQGDSHVVALSLKLLGIKEK
jgi:hypothetical protein